MLSFAPLLWPALILQPLDLGGRGTSSRFPSLLLSQKLVELCLWPQTSPHILTHIADNHSRPVPATPDPILSSGPCQVQGNKTCPLNALKKKHTHLMPERWSREARRPHSHARCLTFMCSWKPGHSPLKSALLLYHCTDEENEAQRDEFPAPHGRAICRNPGCLIANPTLPVYTLSSQIKGEHWVVSQRP